MILRLKHENSLLNVTVAISDANDTLKIWSSLILSFSRTSWRLPFGQYIDKTHAFIGSIQAPTRGLMFLWLKLRIWNKRKKSIDLLNLVRISENNVIAIYQTEVFCHFKIDENELTDFLWYMDILFSFYYILSCCSWERIIWFISWKSEITFCSLLIYHYINTFMGYMNIYYTIKKQNLFILWLVTK